MVATEQDIKKWYDRLHAEKGQDAWRPYEAYSEVLKYFRIAKGKKLLDVGCGTGFFLKHVASKGLDTYGVDISEEGVKIAQVVSPDSKIKVGKGEQLDFPNEYFDYVTCNGALEHFLDMEKGVKEMVRVANKDAVFCIIVPNRNFLPWKLKLGKGTAQQDINENLLSKSEWKNLFSKMGLEIIAIYQDNWPRKNLNIIYKLIWLLLPLNYTYQFVFIMKKYD
jgi:ubiquinone/menaquinone biosynthesis C-methylase UbiE